MELRVLCCLLFQQLNNIFGDKKFIYFLVVDGIRTEEILANRLVGSICMHMRSRLQQPPSILRHQLPPFLLISVHRNRCFVP
jgi:hypothetical protein